MTTKTKISTAQVKLLEKFLNCDFIIIDGETILLEDLDLSLGNLLLDTINSEKGKNLIVKHFNKINEQENTIKELNKAYTPLTPSNNIEAYKWFIECGCEPDFIPKYINLKNYLEWYDEYCEPRYGDHSAFSHIGHTHCTAPASKEQKKIFDWILDQEIVSNDPICILASQKREQYKLTINKLDMGQFIFSIQDKYAKLTEWPLEILD